MTMVNSFNLLFIALLATLAAQLELTNSLPDFNGMDQVALSQLHSESNWNNALPSKGKSLDEQILKTAMTFFILLLSVPLAVPFVKKHFNQQIHTYRSTISRHFHLLI
jgi:hypothetical protein